MIASDELQPEPLHSARLELEPLRVAHAAEMTEVLADPEIYRFTGGQPPTEAELREQYERQVRGRSSDGTELWMNWVVRRVTDRQALGFVQATITREPAGNQAEVAWVIGLPYQGLGFARESVTALVDWLHRQGIASVIAHVHPGHAASEAVARSIGLTPTDQLVDGETRWQEAARPTDLQVSEIADRYRRRADAFETIVAGVRPEQWSNPSPCADWQARDVVQHIVDMHAAMLAPISRRLDPAPSIQADPVGCFRAARRDVEAVLTDPDAAALTVGTPTGPMTVADHIDGVVSADMVLHGWDLARATGQDDTIDSAEVQSQWAANSAVPPDMMDKLRTPGAFGPGIVVFGPEVPVPADAPLQHRLLGFLGRDPNWSAP